MNETTDFKPIFAAVPLPCLLLDPELRILAANDRYLAATLRTADSIVGRDLFDAFPDNPKDQDADGVSNLRASLRAVLATRKPHKMTVQKYDIQTAGDGSEFEVRYWDPMNVPVLDQNGEVTCIIHTVTDVTAQKTAEGRHRISEEQRELLARELEHRGKNTLSLVQAIVAQSLRSAASPSDASARITERLSALGHAQDLLTQTNWRSAPIEDVIARAILVHQERSPRIEAMGPAIQLNAKSALSLALAIHELCTNATKYGALSNGTGTVHVHWSIEESETPQLDFQWREQGGPDVAVPTRKGFGSRLVSSSFGADSCGSADLLFEPEGVIWRVKVPLGAVSE